MFVATLIAAVFQASSSCFGLVLPSASLVVRPYEPVGMYAGHWGVDIAAEVGSDVRVIGPGVVRFSGTVVYNMTVSVDHGGGIVTTYSYLASRNVSKGDRVVAGAVVGESGTHDDEAAYHISLRLDGKYVDPYILLDCTSSPSRGLYLASGGPLYAVERARHLWRYI